MSAANAYPTGAESAQTIELRGGTWQAADADRFRRLGGEVTIIAREQQHMSDLDRVMEECAGAAVMYNGRSGNSK